EVARPLRFRYCAALRTRSRSSIRSAICFCSAVQSGYIDLGDDWSRCSGNHRTAESPQRSTLPQTRGRSAMTSIYKRVLGSDFARLHPMIQQRFGFSSVDNIAAVGRGVMEELWHGRFYTLPFLYVGTWRRIMFPERGTQVPFTIENYAYRDSYGRETVTWVRTFKVKRERRFDATMIYSEQRGKIVDYLGSHQH